MQDFQTTADVLKKLYDHDMKSCYDNVMNTCHDKSISLICHDSKSKLSKNDWWYLVNTLEQWKVYNPRAIITKYGPFNCWEAMQRTKENHPRIPGAYFTKVVRNIVKEAA